MTKPRPEPEVADANLRAAMEEDEADERRYEEMAAEMPREPEAGEPWSR